MQRAVLQNTNRRLRPVSVDLFGNAAILTDIARSRYLPDEGGDNKWRLMLPSEIGSYNQHSRNYLRYAAANEYRIQQERKRSQTSAAADTTTALTTPASGTSDSYSYVAPRTETLGSGYTITYYSDGTYVIKKWGRIVGYGP